MKILTRGKDINTLVEVGGVKPFITQGRTTDGDSLFSSSRRLRATIPVAATGSNSEVHAGVNGPVDGIV